MASGLLAKCANMNGTPGNARAPYVVASACSCCGMNASRRTMGVPWSRSGITQIAKAVRVRDGNRGNLAIVRTDPHGGRDVDRIGDELRFAREGGLRAFPWTPM